LQKHPRLAPEYLLKSHAGAIIYTMCPSKNPRVPGLNRLVTVQVPDETQWLIKIEDKGNTVRKKTPTRRQEPGALAKRNRSKPAIPAVQEPVKNPIQKLSPWSPHGPREPRSAMTNQEVSCSTILQY
jgi:hypothetical protein